MNIVNSHIHTFSGTLDVPENFLPLGLVRFLSTKYGFQTVAKVLNILNPLSEDDLFKKYLKFVTIGKLGSQKKIFEECAKYYPTDTKFCLLSMDMAYMGCGKVPRLFYDQLKELGDLKKIYPQIIPFIHVDPRREDILDLTKMVVEKWGFGGVKLYPTLGYFPYDKDLSPIYDYCERNNLPVIAHCSPNNPVFFKGSYKELYELLKKDRYLGSKLLYDIAQHKKTKKELCRYFTNPLNYKKVMEEFPKLKICAAHFGSEYSWDKYLKNPDEKENWFVYIRDMIKEYENFYTDISFTLNNEEYFSVLKVMLSSDEKIRDKVNFGSDFYMVETSSDEKKFGFDLRGYLGEELFEQIASTNPKKFLGI